MVFPPIHWFQGIKGKRGRLSDIEFLSKKEFDGKLKTATGTNKTTTGDLATLTATSGKDMYLAVARISYSSDGAGDTIVVLKVNGATKATFESENSTLDLERTHDFAMVGLKVAATQIIKLEVTQADVNIKWSGELVCFEEDTGVDPTI